MPKLPVLSARDLLRILRLMGFEEVRQKGSHIRLRHPDGRATTVAVHGNSDLPKGLLRKIIREDIGMELDEFILWHNTH
ncbi:MAG: type II toxin-antitoxin system HicA family toxin [Spirochaetota bacterium]